MMPNFPPLIFKSSVFRVSCLQNKMRGMIRLRHHNLIDTDLRYKRSEGSRQPFIHPFSVAAKREPAVNIVKLDNFLSHC
jgi:hypothetical protein